MAASRFNSSAWICRRGSNIKPGCGPVFLSDWNFLSEEKLMACLKTVASAILDEVEPWLPVRRKKVAMENIAEKSGCHRIAGNFKQALRPVLIRLKN